MANYHSDEWIMNKLQYHYEEAQKIVPKEQIIGIFAIGSMNHGLDCENSDVDSKCVVAPSIKDIVLNLSIRNTPYFIDNHECIEIIDIRIFIDLLIKHSLTRIEALFTPYYIINPIYQHLWQELIVSREQIATYNTSQTLYEIYQQMRKYRKRMISKHPVHIATMKQFGYLPKYLYQIVRLEEFHKKIMSMNVTYLDCLHSDLSKKLIDIKTGNNPLELTQALKQADTIISNTLSFNMQYKQGKTQINKNILSFLNNIKKEIIILSLKNSCEEW